MSKKLKWPKASVVYSIPLYGGAVHLFKSRKKFDEAYRFLGGTYDTSSTCCGNTTHLVNEKGQSLYLIGVYDNDLSTLVHEIGHATLMISEHIGLKAYDSVSEPVCYLLGDMYANLAKAFK